MEEQHREYSKGVWIPDEIWNRDDLSWSEKFLFGQIDKMCRVNEQGDDEPCFASNKWFADKLKVTETSISIAISHLKKLNFIEQVGFDGRKRMLVSNLREVYASYKDYLKNKKQKEKRI